MNKFYLMLSTGLLCGVLCGCSENGFFFRSHSDYSDVEEQNVYYYVGEPYWIKGVLYTPAEDMNYSEKGMASLYTRDTQNRLTTNGEVFEDEKLTAAHKTLPLPSMVRITNLENGNTAVVRVNDRGPSVNNRLIDVSRGVAEALEMSEVGTTPVQVDILPIESRRLKASLEEYTVPDENELVPVDIPTGEVVPVYQTTTSADTPIYNGQNIETDRKPDVAVAVAALPPVAETVSSSVPPVAPPSPSHLQKDIAEQPQEPVTKKLQEKVQPVGSFRIQAGVFGKPANAERAVRNLSQVATVTTAHTGKLTTIYVGSFKSKAEAQSVLEKVRQMGYSDAWIQPIK